MASVIHPSFNNLLHALSPERFSSIKNLIQKEYQSLVSQSNTPVQHTQETSSSAQPEEDGSEIHCFMKRQWTALGDVALQISIQDNEVEHYFRHSLTNSVVDPLEWWRCNKETFPVMAKLARKYLAIPATSVASECMFSFSGGMCTDKCNQLLEDAVGDIVFCNYASKCLAQVASKSAVM